MHERFSQGTLNKQQTHIISLWRPDSNDKDVQTHIISLWRPDSNDKETKQV